MTSRYREMEESRSGVAMATWFRRPRDHTAEEEEERAIAAVWTRRDTGIETVGRVAAHEAVMVLASWCRKRILLTVATKVL
jgi:hypothetical protein